MRTKHPTLGKKKLAEKYFLTAKKDLGEIDMDSPNPEIEKENTNLKKGK